MTKEAHTWTIHHANGATDFHPCYCSINADHDEHRTY